MKNIKYIIIIFLQLVFAMGIVSAQNINRTKSSKGADSTSHWMYWDTTNITNVDDAINALSETERVLGWDGVHGQLDWVYGDVMSDDTYKGGENDNDQPLMRELEIYTHTASNDYIYRTWNELYSGIYRANHLLYALDNKVKPTTLLMYDYTRIKAEARFLRAYFYFRLNMMFAGVPLVTAPLNEDECNTARSTKNEIWTFIEKELIEIIPSLPVKGKEYDNTNALCNASFMKATGVYLITKGAAQALLCKAYLFQQKWALARNEAEVIINSGSYSLTVLNDTTKFDNIFDLEHENGVESIFEIQQNSNYPSDYNYGWGNGDLGTLMNVYWLSRYHDGWGFNIPTDDLANEYEATDKLRKFGTIVLGSPNLIYPELKPYIIGYNGQTRAPRKYIVPRSKFGPSLSDGPSNIRIIRYADVLLMHAEACAQLGDDIAATATLMILRTNRGLTTMAPDVNTSKKFDDGTIRDVVIGSTLLEKIYHERRVELALEGQRFFDLVRWGLAEKKLGPLGYKTYNACFPIPQIVIDASKGIITQNPGY